MSGNAIKSGLGRLSAALLAAVLVIGAPAQLIGEDHQVQSMQQHRRARLYSWLSAQDGAIETALVVAHSVLRESARHSLDPVLVLAVIQVESSFDPKAVSPRGAQGLMQVQRIAVDELIGEGKLPARRRNLHDPQVNVEVGVSYLAHMMEMFGDLHTALAAYNSGPGSIREKIAANQNIPSEYVAKVLKTRRSLELELTRVEVERRIAPAVV